MSALFTAFFNLLNISFNVDGFSFTLLDVFYAGIILEIIGLFVGKIIFFALNKR